MAMWRRLRTIGFDCGLVSAVLAAAITVLATAATAPPVGAAGAGFVPTAPQRAIDTRDTAALIAGEVRTVLLPTVPVDATGATLNVTVLGGDVPTYLTVWPASQPQPWASNVNVPPHTTVANMVMTGVADQRVNVSIAAGSAHVLVDVVGHFNGDFTGITPKRVLDTREGLGAPRAAVGAGQRIDVDVRSAAGIPPGATALAMNVTATNATDATYVTVWPADGDQPATSNLNVARGQTVANLAVVGLPSSGLIALLNAAGRVDLVADVQGWFDAGGYHPLPPVRLMDTRQRTCGFTLGPGEERRLTVAGAGGVPASGAAAVTLNITAVDPTAGGYLAIYPAGGARPHASTVNFAAGQTVPNAATVGLGAGGQFVIYNPAGTVHVIVDLFGYFTGSALHAGAGVPCPVDAPPPSPVPVAPAPAAPPTGCHPSYDPCIPVGPDVDCIGGGGNGPRYVAGPVVVRGVDQYGLDGDHDGVGCE